MDDYKDFTFDKEAFKGLPEFVDELHSNNKKFMPVLDAGIAMRPDSNYVPYLEGKKKGVFLKIKEG